MIDHATVIRLDREAVNSGDGSELSGDAIERFAQLVFLKAVETPPADLTPGEVLMQRAYEAGWVQCATWAERDDLITDCDSAAYTRERDAALTKLTHGVEGRFDGKCARCGKTVMEHQPDMRCTAGEGLVSARRVAAGLGAGDSQESPEGSSSAGHPTGVMEGLDAKA